jgi:iron complex outermembrane receptor protein
LRYRGWVKASRQEHTELETGPDIVDESERVHGGFRADWGEQFTLLGGASSGEIDQVPAERQLSNFHLLGRWSRVASPTATMSVQAYWDRTNRSQPGAIRDALDTFDFELQHAFRAAARNEVFWGAGYRYQSDQLTNLNPAAFRLIPDDRILRIGYLFLEDGVTLRDDLELKLGIKAEHNVYTHWEFMPSARLGWKPVPGHLLWAAWSRAVRTPARVDREFFSPGSPPFLFLEGGPNFVSEVSSVTELGWRAQPFHALSLSVTGFYHAHDGLRTLETQTPPTGPQFENGIDGKTWGAETWAKYRVTDHWRLNGGLVLHRREAELLPGSTDINGLATLGDDPDYWWSLGTSVDVSRVEADATLRQIGPMSTPAVPRYTTIDARVGVEVVRGLDLSVAGRNLLQPRHVEWGPAGNRAAFERAYFVQLRWQGR